MTSQLQALLLHDEWLSRELRNLRAENYSTKMDHGWNRSAKIILHNAINYEIYT